MLGNLLFSLILQMQKHSTIKNKKASITIVALSCCIIKMTWVVSGLSGTVFYWLSWNAYYILTDTLESYLWTNYSYFRYGFYVAQNILALLYSVANDLSFLYNFTVFLLNACGCEAKIRFTWNLFWKKT